jgi:hypothetical protein
MVKQPAEDFKDVFGVLFRGIAIHKDVIKVHGAEYIKVVKD